MENLVNLIAGDLVLAPEYLLIVRLVIFFTTIEVISAFVQFGSSLGKNVSH